MSGVSYCHAMQVCHPDLKLENTLLDDSPAPRLKICDFGYSKSSVLHSQPKSTVGTPAPEVLLKPESQYDGKIIAEATIPAAGAQEFNHLMVNSQLDDEFMDDFDSESESELDAYSSGEIVACHSVKTWLQRMVRW
ncbi:hypothetical protein V6N13_072303 [Hibiscus sabdariffa]